MGRDEVANCCPDVAVVGGNPAVVAVQKLVDRLPGIVDTAGKVGRCHARSGQIILQLKTNFGGLG
jgi:hypothetical protein